MNTATSMTGTRVDDWRPAPDLVDAIVTASHGDPFAVLGPHVLAPDALAIRAFAPGAERAEIIDRATGAACAIMERLDDRGFFAARVKGLRPDGYRGCRPGRGPRGAGRQGCRRTGWRGRSALRSSRGVDRLRG